MLQSDSLPLAEVVDDEVFQEAFDEFGIEFGGEDAVYTSALTLWAMVAQMFFKDGVQRTLKGAVANIASWWAMNGREVDSVNTGAYSRARAKIPYTVIEAITERIAKQCEAAVDFSEPLSPQDAAEAKTPQIIEPVREVPHQGRIVLIDGFTVTADDTEENQKDFPQNPSQAEGLGFPILRCVCLISLATGLLHDLAFGPYSGKESGETALLRSVLDSLQTGDIIVADCYHCTFWLLVECERRGIKIVMKNHHKRDDFPADAKVIRKGQRKVVWSLPKRPDWMSEEECASMPKQVTVYLLDIKIDQLGFRTAGYTIATTFDLKDASMAEIVGSIYRCRWFVELDIRTIKCTLGMDHLRAKSPEMIKATLWAGMLAYNLIRMKMIQSGIVSNRDIRSMSFASCLTQVSTSWLAAGIHGPAEAMVRLGQRFAELEPVGQRPDRSEPRANKKRPRVLALLKIPRQQYAGPPKDEYPKKVAA
ncbi:MAG: IS4 family transposase [Planctomycetota bacterium]